MIFSRSWRLGICLLERAVALVVLAYLVYFVAAFAAEALLVPVFLRLDDAAIVQHLLFGVVGRCKARGSRRQVIDGVHDSSFACHFQPCMSPIDRHCFCV